MEPAEVEVTLEDQQHINLFGRLNSRLHEIDDELRANKEEAESLEDASNEAVLTDDAALRCLWGEAFLHLPRDDLDAELDTRRARLGEAQSALEEERKRSVAKMAELKVILYGKFKDSINLEEE